MINSIITILQYALIGYTLSKFEPFVWVVRIIRGTNKMSIGEMVEQVVGCGKCWTFWFTLISTGSLTMASIAFWVYIIYRNKLSHWEEKQRL